MIMENRRVNLFLVGAMRAGTTSLRRLLTNHPDIYFSPIKEPHYFAEELPITFYEPSRFFNIDSYFINDFPNYLHTAKVDTDEHYRKLFSLAKKEQYFAEASTGYLHAPNCAENIHAYNPDATIVIILRDPIKRAYSHFNMNTALGRETRSFETIIKRELEAYNGNELSWDSYLQMSSYDSAIDRYKRLFNNVVVLKLENLTSNFDEEFDRLNALLNIEPLHEVKFSHRNITRKLRFQRVFHTLRKWGVKDYFSTLFNSKFKRWLFKALSIQISKEIPLSKEVKDELAVIFRKESSGYY